MSGRPGPPRRRFGPRGIAAVTGHPALARPAVVAAVGARELSGHGLELCAAIGRALAGGAHTVRTGGAPGADRSYAAAAVAAGGALELVLPWRGFAGPPPGARVVVADPRRHGEWFALGARCDAGRRYAGRPPVEALLLAARNAGIMLGGAGMPGAPALCVAVHPGAAPSGGTAHALACAAAAGVPALVLREPGG